MRPACACQYQITLPLSTNHPRLLAVDNSKGGVIKNELLSCSNYSRILVDNTDFQDVIRRSFHVDP